ncbi:hypothetical protein G4Y79_16745 [Phototrophicus methaneseepsis]|uniref:Dockerin domain-containing protein n=1 Tax=Phototrophicus methaneseepsis TaxID=2710758 RepID=A0A7S8E6N7_9CHLR|nr:hypothetical protein [Phototrophicus methaneseepsis]QPC81337.1 hypothetical protein G4Y79_16745 [Phototrophicus methaneseepsis]
MSRKLLVSVALIMVVGMVYTASADPVAGCYATASATTIKEDEDVTITVQCDDVPTLNNVFGFQIGTTQTGDFDVATQPTSYTAGTFADVSTGATSGVITGVNTLSGLYAVSRQGSEIVNVEDFTLGSFLLTAEDDLTTDGSIDIVMTDGDFILSDNQGASLSGWLRDVNDISVTVTDIDLAWLSGDMEVRSDVTTISSTNSIDFTLGDKDYSVADIASYTNTFNMDVTYRYSEDGTPASDGTLNISAAVDMTGHLACSDTINLGDTGSATDVDTIIGSAGTVTLNAGDADDDGDIDNTDATAIGANYSTNPGDDKDINGDDILNILDLVHVGRNFGQTSGSCGTGS